MERFTPCNECHREALCTKIMGEYLCEKCLRDFEEEDDLDDLDPLDEFTHDYRDLI